MKTALLFGSSGFIGSHLLEKLLGDPEYTQVTVVVRKDLPFRHPKLKILIGNLNSLPALQDDLAADETFIALGTTKKHTPDPEEYYRVDHDYPVQAAKYAKEKGAQSIFLVSAVGADADSKVNYVRAKGETERDILALGFRHTHIFRPSMLLGQRKENRPLERVIIRLWPLVDPLLLGKRLSKYRGIDGKDVARALAQAAKSQSDKVRVYHWDEMRALLKGAH